MEALFHLDFVKCGYEGTRRMRSAMHEAGLPEPVFEQKELDGFAVHVALANDIEHRREFIDSVASKYIPENVFKKLSSEEKTIVNYLAEKGPLNITDTTLLLAVSWPTAQKYIKRLVDLKIIVAITRSGKRQDSTKKYTLRMGDE